MGTAPFTKPATIVKTFFVIINRVRKNIFHGDKSFRVESDVEMLKNDFPMTDFKKSIMVGDTDSDILFGKNLGMKTVRIKTEEPISIDADYTCLSLKELSKKIYYEK